MLWVDKRSADETFHLHSSKPCLLFFVSVLRPVLECWSRIPAIKEKTTVTLVTWLDVTCASQRFSKLQSFSKLLEASRSCTGTWLSFSSKGVGWRPPILSDHPLVHGKVCNLSPWLVQADTGIRSPLVGEQPVMRGALLDPPTPDPHPDLPLGAVLDPGWDAVRTIGEGDSQPSPSLSTSPSGFLPGSSIQETDLDAAADTVSMARSASAERRASMRGLLSLRTCGV